MTIRIAVVGDHNEQITAHRAVPRALDLAARRLGLAVEHHWHHSTILWPEAARILSASDGVWCVPGSPYASTEGALAAIRYARETGLPFLGTCGGFQHMVLEYARNVLGQADAAHAELEPGAAEPVIAPLSCALVECRGLVRLAPDSRLVRCYGTTETEEGYHCSYGLAPGYEERLARAGLRVSARDMAGEVRALELDGDPFYVGTLFQPERAALAGTAPPPVIGFLTAAAARARVVSRGQVAGAGGI